MQSMSCLVADAYFDAKVRGLPAGKKEMKLADTEPQRPAAWYRVLSYMAQGQGILTFEVPYNKLGRHQGVYVITLDNPLLHTVGMN